jgi:5-dehydro-2-deoxygluconokinase
MNKLFILAFDHRSSFLKLLRLSDKLQAEQKEVASEAKEIIFEGFRAALQAQKVERQRAAILVDEEFGVKVIEEAKGEGYAFAVPVEASGKKVFEFEHGKDFGEHIDRIKPTFVKALVRYNPEGDEKLNLRQAEKLASLSEFCADAGYEWMLEVLIEPTEEQQKKANEEAVDFDKVTRPKLQISMVKELQAANVNPNIWKIEGMEEPYQYEEIVKQARASGNEKVRVIILGRGEDVDRVERWLVAGKDVDGVAGFAIGRTIFTEPLKRWRAEKISHVQAVSEIGENYARFVRIME